MFLNDYYETSSEESGDSNETPQLLLPESIDNYEEDKISYGSHVFGKRSFPATEHTKNGDVTRYQQTIKNYPKPLPSIMWTEPDPSSFKVRGKTYKKDNKKINAGNSMFRLITVDIVEVSSPFFGGVGAHPKERIQQAMARQSERDDMTDMPPFVVIINLILPGPPTYHLVMYFAVDDMSNIDGSDGTPFSKLANKFFFGDSDEFRDNTFKLIPKIVEGNFLVRSAAGSKPVITGTKLKQHYIQGDRHFELILDIGSSSVAAGVVRLSLGYAKTLVVDMVFVLEGNDETTLPEKAFGCCRLKNVDVTKGIRICEQVED